MKENDKLTELRIDEWIWVVFIILSILNIYGDELEKKFFIMHKKNYKELSKKIFTFTVFVSFLIYLYLSYKKYGVLIKKQTDSICETRFFASALVVIASGLYLYCQLIEKDDTNPSIV